jgi:hypothetical protein
MTMSEGSEAPPFDWGVLVPLLHPIKVAIIEALRWTEQPLSASNLSRVFEGQKLSVNRLAYHVNGLAEAGAIVKVRQRAVRGALEKFYFFP